MSETSGMSEYQAWVARLPESMEAALMVGDVAPTAFYQARRAGWDVEQLTFDALAAIHRGAGVGALVTRLRTLSEHSPSERRAAVKGNAPAVADRMLEEFDVSKDPNGERLALMRRIQGGELDPDAAELAMVELQAGLRFEHGVDKRHRVPVRGWMR